MFFLLLLVIVGFLVFAPGVWVRQVLKKYSQPADRYPVTGGEFARKLLDQLDLEHVQTEVTAIGDHYDPVSKTVRLTEDKYSQKSLTALTVAAHEVGHALQDHVGYQPLKLRTRMVRFAQPAEKLGAGILITAPLLTALTKAPSAGIFMFLGGLLALGTATVVHLLTLPTEFDASFNRAMPILEEGGYLYKTDFPHARRLLTAAAFTYVSASLMSLLNIGRWFAILRR